MFYWPLSAAPSATFVGLKSSYPTLVVPGDKEQVHGKALDGNRDVAEPPENSRHKSGNSSRGADCILIVVSNLVFGKSQITDNIVLV